MHSGSSLKSHTSLHNYGRETSEREWDQKKLFFLLSSFCLGWVTSRVSWGLLGLLSSSWCKQCFSLLFRGWSKPRASHINCSWGILQFCLLYPQGTLYTNKREQEKNPCGKALMSCAETPRTIWYVNHGISHYEVRKKIISTVMNISLPGSGCTMQAFLLAHSVPSVPCCCNLSHWAAYLFLTVGNQDSASSAGRTALWK